MLILSGIAIVVIGFVLRFNPLLVVTTAALATGLAAGLGPVEVISAFGKAFSDNRYVSAIWIVLPVIGLLERAGLQERARQLIATLEGATIGRTRRGECDPSVGCSDIRTPPPGDRSILPPTATRSDIGRSE